MYTTDPTNTPELTFTAEKAASATDLTSPTTLINAQDITTVTSDIQMPNAVSDSDYGHKISAGQGATVNDQWRFTVTFVNLESDQNANTGKSFTGQIVFAQTECA